MKFLSTSFFYRWIKRESFTPDIYKESILMANIIKPAYLRIRRCFPFPRTLPQIGLLLAIFIFSFYNPVAADTPHAKLRLGLLFLPVLFIAGIVKSETKFPRVTPFDLPVFSLFFIAVLSLRKVQDFNALYSGLRELMSLCVFIISIYLVIYVFTKKDIKRLFYGLGLAGIGASLIFILSVLAFKNADVYLKNSFGNLNHLGYFLVLTFPVAFVISMDMKNSGRRNWFRFWRLGSILMVPAVFFTHSLGAWVSLLLSFIILAVIFKKKNILIQLTTIIIACIIAFSLPPARRIILGQISVGYGSTIMARMEIWKEVLANVYERPVLGIGFGQFAASARPYYAKEMYNAFSVFLHLAATTGVAGLGLFLWFLARAFKLNISLLRTEKLYGAALFASLTGGVSGFFWDTHLLAVMINWLLGLLLGSSVVLFRENFFLSASPQSLNCGTTIKI
jgi:O-antigen ligase